VKKVESMALPISLAVSIVLVVVAGALASPPLTGILYLVAVLAGAGGTYVLLGARGQEEEAPTTKQPLGKKSDWHEAVEDLQHPEHAVNAEATSS
jgi:hypothetical protein